MIINFEGEQHNFPDDASEDEIRSALSALPKKPPKEDVTAGMALRGIPVLGAYVPQAEAAIRSAAQPFTGVGQPGESYSERYAKNLAESERQYRMAEQESPITSEALKIGGGVAATAPLAATALGGRVLGASGGMASRLGFGGASGAGLSAADVAARGGSAEDALEAAKWGGAVGAAAPMVAGAASRAISPFISSEPTRQAAAQVLRREGVQPSAGQVTGNRMLQLAEQQLGELGGMSPSQRTAESFTGAALRRVGETSNRATADVMDNAFTRIGKQFDDLAARNTLQPDPAMGPQIRQAIADYDRLVSPPNRVPVIRDYEGEIGAALAQNRGTIPGAAYQSLRSRMEADARSIQRSSPEVADALRGMKNALDDAMERFLQRTRSPDVGAWQQARNQYRNLLVLEKAAANPNTREGLITPATLFSATKQVQGIRNMVRGRGDYANLARAGSDVLRDYPSSGTAQRAFIMGAPAALGGLYGGLTSGDPTSAAMWGGAGLLAGPLAGRAIMSRPAQAYLRNQLMAGPTGQTFRGGVQGGLLGMMGGGP
jgi:hypothetical protein